MDKIVMLKDFYRNKKVLITGHSGFKGSWLALTLFGLGAELYGLSDMSVESGIYKVLKKNKIFKNEYINDITDEDFVKKTLINQNYDIVFHFAAQGLVSKASEDPKNTILTNVLGTYNVLNATNLNKNIENLIIATTDKVYEEHNAQNTENFKLGGKEFYSASKASSEHIISAFNNTSKRSDLNVGVVRAGNVLGGGDYGKDRVLTDVINSIKSNQNILLRNPKSIRPWQYVLDSIFGYLLVGEYCNENKKSDIFNLNSTTNNKVTVKEFVDKLIECWSLSEKIEIQIDQNNILYESEVLTIDSTKAKNILGWQPNKEISDICEHIVAYEKNDNKFNWAVNHINEFIDSYY